jgi:hypothetical protein
MFIDIATITNITYENDKTFISCKATTRKFSKVLLYQPGGIQAKIAIGKTVILFRYQEWALDSHLLAFYIGKIDKIKITSNEVNLIKQISLGFASILLSLQYNIDAHNTTVAVYTALEASNLDAPTKAVITTQKGILQAKITSLTNEKNTLQNIKTEIDKTFFE